MGAANIRNIAIIAHVDHGKTTLVDKLLTQAGTFRANQATAERMMDSMDLEREKGITIKAKNCQLVWNGIIHLGSETRGTAIAETIINVVDTPGHADFGGEVERIMKMVDGCLLVVDALEGPQAQTKFVLRKALSHGIRPIVVVNKIDREHADPKRVHDKVLELLMELNATPEQFDAPFLYVSARDGFAKRTLDDPSSDMRPLFETIVQRIPPPAANLIAPFQFLVSNLGYDDHLGRIAYGRIIGGRVKVGDSVVCIHKDGRRDRQKITMLFNFSGMNQKRIEEAEAGNIVGITGFEEIAISETITDNEERQPIPFVEIDPPTIKMQFCVNDGPLAGKEGKLVTARNLRDRLFRECRTNVSLEVEETNSASVFNVNCRGEMQIAVLVEQMRREGFEVLVSRPEVIYKKQGGKLLEPIEDLFVEVPNEKLGDILQNLAGRKAEIKNMHHHGTQVSIEAVIPTRGVIGFETELVNATSGEGFMSHLFREYAPFLGEIATRHTGALVAMENGVATAYALNNIQERGILFIEPGDAIYEGMIVGENPRDEDIVVNPCTAKRLTNMRSQGDGKGVQLSTPLKMSLERSIEYLAADEYLEATPKSLRLRKKLLSATARKRAGNAIKEPVAA
jgi:GTP-binding protein